MNWLTRYLTRNNKPMPVHRCPLDDDLPSPSLQRLRELVEQIEFSPISTNGTRYDLEVHQGKAQSQILKNSIDVGIAYAEVEPETHIPFHEHQFEVEHIIVTDGELHIEIEVEEELRHYKITKNGYFKICPKMRHRLYTKDKGVRGVVILVPGSDHWPGYSGEDDE